MTLNKICNKCNLDKPLIDFHQQSDCSDGHRGTCKSCVKAIRQVHYSKNRQSNLDKNLKWRQSNNRTDYFAKYKKENKEKIKEYAVKTRHLNAKRKATRRDRMMERTPKWLNSGELFEIECIYKYCGALRSIGLKYEVDHIIPLAGKNASGLHVPSNLQVIPMIQNRQKSNKLPNSSASSNGLKTK